MKAVANGILYIIIVRFFEFYMKGSQILLVQFCDNDNGDFEKM